mgnify:CR=1 FL=1
MLALSFIVHIYLSFDLTLLVVKPLHLFGCYAVTMNNEFFIITFNVSMLFLLDHKNAFPVFAAQAGIPQATSRHAGSATGRYHDNRLVFDAVSFI